MPQDEFRMWFQENSQEVNHLLYMNKHNPKFHLIQVNHDLPLLKHLCLWFQPTSFRWNQFSSGETHQWRGLRYLPQVDKDHWWGRCCCWP